MSFLSSTTSFIGPPSTPSLNHSLAWSMGSRGEGRFHIKFPLQLDWYNELPCTSFTSLQHRKERTGFQHEYIVLNLDNGAVCRLERMGDADARFDAIRPQGTAAYDFAQCFQPEHISRAHLRSSDVIAQIIFPLPLDLIDVLAICRAIQEGDKTCNYTLQSFNCYFFSLAIQSTLARLMADWDSISPQIWMSAADRAFDVFLQEDQHALHSRDGLQVLPLILSLLNPHTKQPMQTFVNGMRSRLSKTAMWGQVDTALCSTLWHSDLGSAVDSALGSLIRDVIELVLKDGTVAPTFCQGTPSLDPTRPSTPTEGSLVDLGGHSKSDIVSHGALIIQLQQCLISLILGSISKHRSEQQPPRLTWMKRYLLNRRGIQPSNQLKPSEMDFRPQSSPADEPINGAQHASKLFSGLAQMLQTIFSLLWIMDLWLRFLKWLFWRHFANEKRPAVDKDLVLMLLKLEPLNGLSLADLTTTLKQIKALVADEDALSWNEWPWAYIHKSTKPHILGPLYNEEKAVLKVTFQQGGAFQATGMSTFQGHLRGRIDEQAKLVEKNWLGSANSISKELEEKLSQVWILLRNDPDYTFPYKGLEALAARLLDLSRETRLSLIILLQLGGKNKQTITMDEFERVMKELGMELVNGKGAQFKAKPTIFGPNKPNITFHRVPNLGHMNMVDKGNSFRKSYPDVVRLMEQLWGL